MERMHRRPPDVEEALSSMLWTPYERTPTDSSSEDEDEQLNRKLHKSNSSYQYRSQEYDYCSGSTTSPTSVVVAAGLTFTNDTVASIEPTVNNVLTPFVPSLINSNNCNITNTTNNSIITRKIERCENFRFSYPHYGPIPSLQQKSEKTEPPSYESLYANNTKLPVFKKLIAAHNYPSSKNVTPLLTADRRNEDSVTTNYEQTWCDSRNRMVHSFTDNFIIGSTEVVQDLSSPTSENDVIEKSCNQPSLFTNEFSKSSSASITLQKQTIGKEITDCISGNVDSINNMSNDDDFNIFEDYSNYSNQCGSNVRRTTTTNEINNHNFTRETDEKFKSEVDLDHEHDPNCKYNNYHQQHQQTFSSTIVTQRTTPTNNRLQTESLCVIHDNTNNSHSQIDKACSNLQMQPQQHQRTLSTTIVAKSTPTNNRVQPPSQCVSKISQSSDFNVNGGEICDSVQSCSTNSVHSVKLSDIFLNSYAISSPLVTSSSPSSSFSSSSSSLLSLKSPSNQLTENSDNTLNIIRSSESAIIKRNNNLNFCKISDDNNIELTYLVDGVINDRINKNLNQTTAMRLNIPAAASLASTTSLAKNVGTTNSSVFLTNAIYTTTTTAATATTPSPSFSKSPNYLNINNNNNCIAISSSCPLQGLQILDQQKSRTTIGPSSVKPIETEIIQPSLTIHVNESNNNHNQNHNKNHNNNNNNNNNNSNANCQKDVLGNNFVVNANNKGISVVNCSYRNSDSNNASSNIITTSSSSSNKCNNSTTGNSSGSSNAVCNINHSRSSGCSVPNLNNCVNNNLNINHFNNYNNNNNNNVNDNDNENSYSDNHHMITTTSDDINIVQRYKNNIIATKMPNDIIPSNVVVHGPPSSNNYHNHNNVNIENNNANRCKDNNNTSNSIGLPKTTISSLPSSSTSSSLPSSQSTTPQRTFISTECQTDDLQAIVRDESRNGDASGNAITSGPVPITDSGPLTTLPVPSDALLSREQRRRERRERRHQHAQMARNRHPHILPPPAPQMISNGVVTTAGILRPMLPDILHSHYPPPYSALPLTNPPSRPNSSLIAPVMTAVPITAAATAVGDGRFTIPLPIIRRSPSERSGKGCCGQWFAGPPLRALIAVVALGGVACALGGAALGATGLAGPPSSHLTAALLMIGVGVILVTVSGAAWRMTAPGGPPCLGLGSSVDLGRCGRRPCSRGGGAPHGLLYPEFQHRPPPPSYQASMQEYRLRLLLLDRDRQNGVVRGSSPPPTYRSHAGSLLRTPLTTTNRGPGASGGLSNIGGPGSEYSLPPSYRSRNTNTHQTVVASVTNVISRPTSVVGSGNDVNVKTTTASVTQPQQLQSNGVRLTTLLTPDNNLPEYTSLQENPSRILNISNQQQASVSTTPVQLRTTTTTPEIHVSTTTANEIQAIATAKDNRRQDTTNATTYLIQNFNEKLNPRVLSNNCNNLFNLNSVNLNQQIQHQHPPTQHQQQMSTTNSSKSAKKDLVTIVTISADPSVNSTQPQQQQTEMEILAHL